MYWICLEFFGQKLVPSKNNGHAPKGVQQHQKYTCILMHGNQTMLTIQHLHAKAHKILWRVFTLSSLYSGYTHNKSIWSSYACCGSLPVCLPRCVVLHNRLRRWRWPRRSVPPRCFPRCAPLFGVLCLYVVSVYSLCLLLEVSSL